MSKNKFEDYISGDEYEDDENQFDLIDEDMPMDDSYQFGEFDSKDVVNKSKKSTSKDIKNDEADLISPDEIIGLKDEVDISSDSYHSSKTGKRLDVDSILNYDDNLRKANLFKLEFDQENEPDDESERLKDSFLDFLELKKIAGRKKGFGYLTRIPSEALIDSGEITEIVDTFSESSHTEDSTVLIHKSNTGDISHIEFICACGRRTIIKLDYDSEDEPEENTDE